MLDGKSVIKISHCKLHEPKMYPSVQGKTKITFNFCGIGHPIMRGHLSHRQLVLLAHVAGRIGATFRYVMVSRADYERGHGIGREGL